MKRLLFILFICSCGKLFAQTANAGADKTIYLTQTNSVTLDGSASTGTSYSWAKIYDVQQPQAGYPLDPATIVSPTSATTNVTGLIQGVWYYQLSVTSGSVTKKDTVVVKVDVEPPPINFVLERWLPLNDAKLDTAVNNRKDTSQSAQDPNGLVYTQGYIYLNRDRYNDLMIDSSRGKLYATVEDGYYWPFTLTNPGVHGKYSRGEIHHGTAYIVDTTKTYIYEWKGYYPQSILGNMPLLDPVDNQVFSAILTIMQVHGNSDQSGPWQFKLTHDYLQFQESNAVTKEGYYNSGSANINLFTTDDANLLNKTHTFRVETRQGKGYPGQDAYIKLYVDGGLVYQRDTGTVGQTLQHDYIKYGGIYDYRNVLTSPDSLARGKKFSLVTEAMNIYVKNYPIVNAGGSMNVVSTSATLQGTSTPNPDRATTYLCTKISGPGTQTILNNTTLAPTITGLQPGNYVFRITATDSYKSNYSDVTITVAAPANNPPTIDAGPDQIIQIPTTSLSGSVNVDPGLSASYLWTKKSGNGAITNETTLTPILSNLNGESIWELRVDQSDGQVASDDVKITANVPTPISEMIFKDKTIFIQ